MILRRVTWSALTFRSILVVACGGSIDASPENDAAGAGQAAPKLTVAQRVLAAGASPRPEAALRVPAEPAEERRPGSRPVEVGLS